MSILFHVLVSLLDWLCSMCRFQDENTMVFVCSFVRFLNSVLHNKYRFLEKKNTKVFLEEIKHRVKKTMQKQSKMPRRMNPLTLTTNQQTLAICLTTKQHNLSMLAIF